MSPGKPPKFRPLRDNPQHHEIVLDGREIQESPAAKLAVPVRGDAERINLWITVITGMELTWNGSSRDVLPAEIWKQRRQQLDQLGGSPEGRGER
jgi:hypothetical protein